MVSVALLRVVSVESIKSGVGGANKREEFDYGRV